MNPIHRLPVLLEVTQRAGERCVRGLFITSSSQQAMSGSKIPSPPIPDSVFIVIHGSEVDVKVSLRGISRLYSYDLSEKLSLLLADLKGDFSAVSSNVTVTDGEYEISPNTIFSRVWRKTATRDVVFAPLEGEECPPVALRVGLETPDREDGPYRKTSIFRQPSHGDVGHGEMRYVLVTGGVLSGIGKGMTASSVGVLMRSMGFRVTAIKIDPYLNVDAGTMSPFEHGEVFVLDDGGETDLDLGNYERFLDVTLTRDNNLTTGKVYSRVLERERRGDYLGKTVQVVPHLTNAIIEWIDRVAHVPVDGSGTAAHVCIIELGGTVGDIESAPYIEALRQFQFQISKHAMARIHVSLVPTVGDGEEKTKPTQHSVKNLRAAGLHPDIVVCRSSKALSQHSREKIGQFCHTASENVISAHDIENLYHLPLLLKSQNMHLTLTNLLDLAPIVECDVSEFAGFGAQLSNPTKEVKICLIGKYTSLKDAYLSVIKALTHSAMAVDRKLTLLFLESAHLELDPNTAQYKDAWATLEGCDGVLVPGGFGDRGIEGKIAALKFAREKGVPTLGVCLGMQLMVVEYARNVLGWSAATSEEFDSESRPGDPVPETKHVVIYMPEVSRDTMGGTMRLGARATLIKSRNSLGSRLYGTVSQVSERHRHRYEVNPKAVEKLEQAGLQFVGHDETKTRMEIVELPESTHRFYFGTQYHPEFKSRPGRPSPPFLGLLLAASKMALP